MKNKIRYLLIFIAFLGCDQEGAEQKVEAGKLKLDLKETEIRIVEKEATNFDLEKHMKHYQTLKASILNYKKELSNTDAHEPQRKIEMVENHLSRILVDSIFPYWQGTKWDFNGHTENPRNGEVACGYFVSTTIRDLGFKINRFKIAQKAASDIISALCDPSSIVRTGKIDQLAAIVQNSEEYEIFIVGLDFHVGFLFKKNHRLYFTHSNYIDRKGVEIELIENSAALKNSEAYVIGNFTKNKEMIEKWLD